MKLFLLLFFLYVNLGLAQVDITKVNFSQIGELSTLVIETNGEVVAEKYHLVDKKQILLDLKNVKADPKVLRSIDTSEFSGATVFVSGFVKEVAGDEVRFVINLRDNVQSKLNISNNQVSLIIENRFGVFAENANNGTEAGTLSDGDGVNVPRSGSVSDILENITASGNKKYAGKRISINVKGLPISELLKMIADTSGFNIIVDNAVTSRPPMTITLTNTPWDEALDTILKLNKLVARKHLNILQVLTEEDFVKEKQVEQENKDKLRKKDPIVTKVFPVSFGKLDDIISVIKEYKSERGGTLKDERTNTLIVKDTVENIQKIAKVIKMLDSKTPQVMIEAKIVEVTENNQLDLGFAADPGLRGGYKFSGAPEQPNDAAFTFSPTSSGGLLGASVSVYRRLQNLNFTLNLLETEERVKIISSPRVVTRNKQAAKIGSTQTRRFQTGTSTTGAQPIPIFEAVDASISLDVTPQVSNDGSIGLDIKITKQDFDISSSGAPNLLSNDINTSVLADNGSTVVIGGLYRTINTHKEQGIPFLKDIPLIGWLFKAGYQDINDRRELIVFITPRIINDPNNKL